MKDEFIVHEGELKFIVNLGDYLDTGLFLDHRTTRGVVKKEAKDKKVLNLFCYTGSFSVYAAAGGAEEVTSVDLSKTYLNWAERNMKLNGFINGTPSGPPVPVRTGDGDFTNPPPMYPYCPRLVMNLQPVNLLLAQLL
jgi:hypothetical protein